MFIKRRSIRTPTKKNRHWNNKNNRHNHQNSRKNRYYNWHNPFIAVGVINNMTKLSILGILQVCLFLSVLQIYRSLSISIHDAAASNNHHNQEFDAPPKLKKDKDGLENNSDNNPSTKSRRQPVHLVVSHCDKSIGWIWKEFATLAQERAKLEQETGNPQQHYDLKSFTIITKCNATIASADLHSPPELLQQQQQQPPLVQVLHLPNVGRCDHSYAYWIKEIMMMQQQQGKAKGGSARNGGQSKENDPNYKLLYSSESDNSNSSSHNNTTPFQKLADRVDSSDMVFFLKDNDNRYRGKHIETHVEFPIFLDQLALETAPLAATTYEELLESDFARPIARGFSCFSYPNPKYFGRRQKNFKFVNLAHRSILWDFFLRNYNRLKRDHLPVAAEYEFQAAHRPMGDWIRHLNKGLLEILQPPHISNHNATMKISLPLQNLFSKEYYKQVTSTNYQIATNTNSWQYFERDMVPLCYGGIFGTYWGQLVSEDSALTLQGWMAVTHALSRGDNIEEGHYMERWWGDLLSYSSWADKQVGAKDTTTNSTRVSGITLDETEQNHFFANKMTHFGHDEIENPFVGLIALSNMKVQKRQKELASRNTTTEHQRQVQLQKTTSSIESFQHPLLARNASHAA